MKMYFAEVDIEESMMISPCEIAFSTDVILFQGYEEYLDFKTRYTSTGGSGCLESLEELVNLINSCTKENQKVFTYADWQKEYPNRERSSNKEAIKNLMALAEVSLLDENYKDYAENENITDIIY